MRRCPTKERKMTLLPLNDRSEVTFTASFISLKANGCAKGIYSSFVATWKVIINSLDRPRSRGSMLPMDGKSKGNEYTSTDSTIVSSCSCLPDKSIQRAIQGNQLRSFCVGIIRNPPSTRSPLLTLLNVEYRYLSYLASIRRRFVQLSLKIKY